ncbi:hypothetical protein RI129_010168 [Pyrocoelia pectoralis]|uniref:Carboxylic ester hydrolase n=1 Tax=Pyrocoelia pectoralis TaxID=417401 RepID=A0AAN7V9Z0_9COLE
MLSVFILSMGYGLPAQSHQFHQPIVYTSLGLIKGNDTLQTILGKTIYSFRGIRYAKAPIGDLRFRPPQPVESWEGIYDASQDGAACPQPYTNDTDEDCLFLNVYTTQMPTEHRNLNLPVLVYIHGGSYTMFSARSNLLGPDYLLDQDMVLVTLNYRLASLGFISTGDEFAPGNNGLKDQVTALKWVKQNIAHFGGNPNSVTLSGHSAGALSVSLHLVSPMSRGLFHKAVMMSGSIMGNYPVLSHQFDLAQKQARFVNCPDRNSEEIIECLKTKSATEIANTLDEFNTERCASHGTRIIT